MRKVWQESSRCMKGSERTNDIRELNKYYELNTPQISNSLGLQAGLYILSSSRGMSKLNKFYIIFMAAFRLDIQTIHRRQAVDYKLEGC